MLPTQEIGHQSGISGRDEEVRPKPRLIFFKYKWAAGLPDFLLTHTREHVSCLSQFFDVIVIDENCDYQEVCDKYEPDIALFESGINISTCRRIKITNIKRYTNVPKVGFFNADAWCETRAGILSEMDSWQIETFFSIAVTAGEHIPGISKNLFVWPNGVNSTIHKDYKQPKLIPILLSGATGPQYPWRRLVFERVAKHYPVLSCPHHGYTSRAGTGQVLHGEAYARVINASLFAPACGTLAKEVVRKHFEIPGCSSCLITEKSPGLQAAGFIDMVNCVFADEQDVLDKIAYLFENPNALAGITRTGHDLVHSKHTFRHRNQVFQWLRLHQRLEPGQRIVQTDPFSPLRIVGAESKVETSYIVSNGLHLSLIREGSRCLWSGELDKAEACYTQCLQYMRRFPEAKFGLALCKLRQGQPKAARDLLVELLQYTLAEYNAADPDPVEWAYYIVTALCLGDVGRAMGRSRQFNSVSHPELERVRWITNLLSTGNAPPIPATDGRQLRVSLHHLPERSIKQWVAELSELLRACGQTELANTASRGFMPTESKAKKLAVFYVLAANWRQLYDAIQAKSGGRTTFRARFLYSKVLRRMGGALARILNGLDKRKAANS